MIRLAISFPERNQEAIAACKEVQLARIHLKDCVFYTSLCSSSSHCSCCICRHKKSPTVEYCNARVWSLERDSRWHCRINLKDKNGFKLNAERELCFRIFSSVFRREKYWNKNAVSMKAFSLLSFYYSVLTSQLFLNIYIAHIGSNSYEKVKTFKHLCSLLTKSKLYSEGNKMWT